MMNNENLKIHYRQEELPFVEKTLGQCEQVLVTHQPFKTDFLDLRQLQIMKNIVNSYMDLTIFYDGGYENAERVRVFIAPDYWVLEEDDIPLSFFQIHGENKFNHLSHRDYLGALLNIGLKREKFGDLLITNESKQLIVAKEIADFVQFQLKQVGRTKVELESISKNDLVIPDIQYEEMQFSVASLRVDTISAHVFKQSRSKMSDFIKGKNLKINWQINAHVDFILQPGDMVSLRGFGRYKFLEEEGNTKKGRFRVKIGKLV